MKYYPVLLDLDGKLCVVVGGGRVAERKVRSLLQVGALVKVISPQLTQSLSRLKERGKIIHSQRAYRSGDLHRAFLAIAATDDRRANERVFSQALRQKIPVNVVDDPAHSSFIVPSLVQRGDLLIAISTSGQSPALARALRQKLQKEIGAEYIYLLKLLGAVRKKILSLGLGQKRNQIIFRKLAGKDLLPLIRKNDYSGLENRMKTLLGSGFSLKKLGLRR
ncbi:MAG: bifunctional precorrin-2 dehydrogenase/sirohydrochlorin ferrochelatase [Deltaproteobacteria bacterium]|nr:bifunctional precorrin-2 dehydrogenase/sirohydrochlorin ferrochelatase [Deltaproteobacteria bacterium]